MSALEEGEKLIVERQKHIRIADRSDNGWATVEEYLEDEFAANSDDEKRLLRADARDTKKLKSAQKSNKNVQKKPGFRKNSNFQGFRGASFPNFNQVPVMQIPATAQPAYKYQSSGGPSVSGLGPCFECGMVGHLRKYCPKLIVSRASDTTSK